MVLEKYKPSTRDTWRWRLPTIADIDNIVNLARQHFQSEMQDIVTINDFKFAHELAHVILAQNYSALNVQLIVAEQNSKIVAYAWIDRCITMPYSDDEMAEARFVHIDQTLPTRARVTIAAQILQQWEQWAMICRIPIIVSSTIRSSQDTFLRLHEQAGYTVRGSIAFKRIGKEND